VRGPRTNRLDFLLRSGSRDLSMTLWSLPAPSLSERQRCMTLYYATARRICLGGEGNALYPVICDRCPALLISLCLSRTFLVTFVTV